MLSRKIVSRWQKIWYFWLNNNAFEIKTFNSFLYVPSTLSAHLFQKYPLRKYLAIFKHWGEACKQKLPSDSFSRNFLFDYGQIVFFLFPLNLRAFLCEPIARNINCWCTPSFTDLIVLRPFWASYTDSYLVLAISLLPGVGLQKG